MEPVALNRAGTATKNLIEQLVSAFPRASSAGSVDETLILANPNVMELAGPTDLLEVVPMYLLWCARNPEDSGLTSDYTLHALAEYGRCRNREDAHLNFRFLCSPSQIAAVVAFAEWASQAFPFCNESQLERTIRRWRSSASNSFDATGPAPRRSIDGGHE